MLSYHSKASSSTPIGARATCTCTCSCAAKDNARKDMPQMQAQFVGNSDQRPLGLKKRKNHCESHREKNEVLDDLIESPEAEAEEEGENKNQAEGEDDAGKQPGAKRTRKNSTSSVCSIESTSSTGTVYSSEYPGLKACAIRSSEDVVLEHQLHERIRATSGDAPPQRSMSTMLPKASTSLAPYAMSAIRKISNTFETMLRDSRDGVTEVCSFVRNQVALGEAVDSDDDDLMDSIHRKVSSGLQRDVSPGTFCI